MDPQLPKKRGRPRKRPGQTSDGRSGAFLQGRIDPGVYERFMARLAAYNGNPKNPRTDKGAFIELAIRHFLDTTPEPDDE